ncbi:dihydrofolate reductase family protein [Staphylospora marina]|uniref:dihydrofolate reductase family protein n=1 Tax=Staphylospora marina TaxID=2490858 RepID=UPI000F5C128B|nr:dihydrofolate reductase family protein [Staphylospora marina]
MQRKVIAYIAMSLDGYISREDGSIDWLLKLSPEPEEYGYDEFIRTVDTVIMGRATYDQLPELSDTFPYADKDCYAFSRTRSGRDEHVRYVNEDPGVFVKRLKNKPGGHIWLVGGAELIRDFIEADLIDEWIIGVVPILIGRGIPLFYPNNRETGLKLVSLSAAGELAMLHYEVIR